jgi:hypothetical protein
MLDSDAAGPHMDVRLNKKGYPVALQARDFFAFLEAPGLTAYQ